jgi:DNA-binding transcriptional ArsR family regulator
VSRAEAVEFYELHARVCKAIADGKRLLIINELRDGPRSVGELADVLGIPQANASQHLAILRDRGIVTARRAGSTIHYSLSSAPAPSRPRRDDGSYGSAPGNRNVAASSLGCTVRSELRKATAWRAHSRHDPGTSKRRTCRLCREGAGPAHAAHRGVAVTSNPLTVSSQHGTQASPESSRSSGTPG